MLVEIKVPVLSESVAEATLLSWHKKQGERVARDENLVDIETDKVVLELPSPVDGVLSSIAKGDGATVIANEVLATIDTCGQTGCEAGSSAHRQNGKRYRAAGGKEADGR
jgi:2-oxoglutarate dehydrogenase E2 component (dihydrolipoamide succinyltransferase)